MKYLLFLFCIAVACPAFAQPTADGKAYQLAGKMPEAEYDMNDYLATHVHYPDSARAHNIQGRVVVQFVVSETGNIEKCKVVKGVNEYLDAEALRVVSTMPPWKPAKQDGKMIAVYYTLPIVFKLD